MNTKPRKHSEALFIRVEPDLLEGLDRLVAMYRESHIPLSRSALIRMILWREIERVNEEGITQVGVAGR